MENRDNNGFEEAKRLFVWLKDNPGELSNIYNMFMGDSSVGMHVFERFLENGFYQLLAYMLVNEENNLYEGKYLKESQIYQSLDDNWNYDGFIKICEDIVTIKRTGI